MKQTVGFYEFHNAFQGIRPNNFSYEGQQALFDYLENYEEDSGQEMELDVIALCCDYSEYTLAEINQDYGYLSENGEFESLSDAVECLRDNTTVIEVDDDMVIVQDF